MSVCWPRSVAGCRPSYHLLMDVPSGSDAEEDSELTALLHQKVVQVSLDPPSLLLSLSLSLSHTHTHTHTHTLSLIHSLPPPPPHTHTHTQLSLPPHVTTHRNTSFRSRKRSAGKKRSRETLRGPGRELWPGNTTAVPPQRTRSQERRVSATQGGGGDGAGEEDHALLL